MSITPLAACAPYMAAEASFNMEIFSMVLGSILSKERPGTPSTTTSGLLLPKVFTPLILIIDPSNPGSLLGVTVTRPGRRPPKLLLTFVTGDFIKSDPFTAETDPVQVAFFAVPYPTTTTSSKFCTASGCSVIVKLECAPTGTSL